MAKVFGFGSQKSIIVGLLIGSLSVTEQGSWQCSANDNVPSDDSYLMTGVEEGMQTRSKAMSQ